MEKEERNLVRSLLRSPPMEKERSQRKVARSPPTEKEERSLVRSLMVDVRRDFPQEENPLQEENPNQEENTKLNFKIYYNIIL